MKMVVIESPYAGDVERNRKYLRACIRDCLRRGENPYASHYMLPNFLDDNKPQERQLGLQMGMDWAFFADAAVFYVDFGMSQGMVAAEETHRQTGKELIYRRLYDGVITQPKGGEPMKK